MHQIINDLCKPCRVACNGEGQIFICFIFQADVFFGCIALLCFDNVLPYLSQIHLYLLKTHLAGIQLTEIKNIIYE